MGANAWEDMGEICSMCDVPRLTPMLLRKAAPTAVCNSLPELDRKRVANHMTHRPETAYRAYPANNRHPERPEDEGRHGEGEGGAAAEDNMQPLSPVRRTESTVPSSVCALDWRWTSKPFSAEEQGLIASKRTHGACARYTENRSSLCRVLPRPCRVRYSLYREPHLGRT